MRGVCLEFDLTVIKVPLHNVFLSSGVFFFLLLLLVFSLKFDILKFKCLPYTQSEKKKKGFILRKTL